MTLHVACPKPSCPNHHTPKPVADDLAGRKTRCGQCGTVFFIGTRPGSPLASPIPAPPPQSTGGVPWARLAIVVGGFGLVLLALIGICLLLIPGDKTSGQAEEDKERKADTQKDLVHKLPLKTPGDTNDLVPGKDGEKKPEDKDLVKKDGQQKTRPKDQKLIIPFDALGPAEKLDRIKVVQLKGKATFSNSPLVTDVGFAWHGLSHFHADETLQGRAIKVIVNGDTGSYMGRPLPRDQLDLFRNEAYGYSLSNLTPLRDKQFQLKKLADAAFQGKDCMVVEAALPGRPTIKLFFAKDTGLLAKSEFISFRGKRILFENQYSDYQETDGVKHWRKLDQLRDGVKYAHLEIHSVQFFDKFDPALFQP